jgi:hypothetical protein
MAYRPEKLVRVDHMTQVSHRLGRGVRWNECRISAKGTSAE